MSEYSKILMPGEILSFSLRPHWRFIVAGVVVGVVTIVVWWIWVGFWSDWLGTNATIPQVIGSLIALVIILRYTIRPVLQWLVTRYIFTNRRVMTRYGIITRHAADIPLDKVSNVYYEQGILDRILRCGSLVIDSSGGDGFNIDNVPGVEAVTRDLHILVEGESPTGRKAR